MVIQKLSHLRSRRAEYWRAYHAVATDGSPGTIVPLENRRVHQTTFTLGLARDLPPVFTVFVAAASALRGEHDTAGYMLAAAEVIAGAGVLLAIGLEARHLFGRQDEHVDGAPHEIPRWDAASLAAAVLGYVEAWHHAHLVGHFKLWSPYTFGATASLFVARYKHRLFSKRKRRRRARKLHVCITPSGISYLGGPRQRWRAEWTEVAAVEHAHGELALRLHDGNRHVLRGSDHFDGGGVLAQTRAAIAAHAPHVRHVNDAVSGATAVATVASAGHAREMIS